MSEDTTDAKQAAAEVQANEDLRQATMALNMYESPRRHKYDIVFVGWG